MSADPAVRTVRWDEVAPQAWRNGAGATRELMAWPEADAWHVRVSVADVDRDGPFSAFAGVRRWFAVLEGGGVVLEVDGVARRLSVGEPPFAFDGGARVDCRLVDGPTRDLNLMLRGVDGALHPVGPEPWRAPAGCRGLFAESAGRCLADGVPIEVPGRTLLWFPRAPRDLSFEPATAAAPSGWWIAAGEPPSAAGEPASS